MQNIIGIDVGTTSIKCSSILPDGSHYDARCNTPLFRKNSLNNQEITFSPRKVWNSVCNLILPILKKFDTVIISVVCQAPSLTFWNEKGEGVGISYLSYYGDPTQNTYFQRRHKTAMRLALANRIISEKEIMYVSGLTGYIVFMLTGQLTLDSVTAWELGIESQEDALDMQVRFKPYIFPCVLPPSAKIPLNCADLDIVHGFSLVGTTDSAVLPISIIPEFSDYYIYLGSWGSLLQSKIRTIEDYNIQYYSGLLNNWLVSIPDFIAKVTANIQELDNLFLTIQKIINQRCKVAICGGLTKAKKEYIQFLIDTHFRKEQAIIVTEKEGAFGAFRLAQFFH